MLFLMGLKKLTLLKKTNYRPISTLTFKRCLYDQIYEYTDNMLLIAQCGFSNNYDWKMEKSSGQGRIMRCTAKRLK